MARRSPPLKRSAILLAAAVFAVCAGPVRAASDMDICADEGVKTSVLPLARLAAAEAACGRVLASAAGEADRQKAAFFRGLTRFLQVVQQGAGRAAKRDGSFAYAPPTLKEVGPALGDVEQAARLEGPLKAEALALRVTINQTIGREAEARADIGRAIEAGPKDATPFVQRALEHERAGDAAAALADLDSALGLDPKAGTALTARGDLLRRLGELRRARDDHAAAAALGPPFRRLALIRKSDVELRLGDLRAAYDDLVAASREDADMPKADAKAANADLLVRAGDLALDRLRDADAAEGHFREAGKLAPKNWGAPLGLARVEEARGQPGKAAAIYRKILAGTKATPRLYERLLAALRLKMLTGALTRASLGPFRDALDSGVIAKGSPDGLRRTAFVIGASDYAELASLPNAKRDAAVMANALAEMGFDAVYLAENPGKEALRGAVAAIAGEAQNADVVLVYYAGHGVEAGGVNHLIPVDAAPESDRDLAADALDLADLVSAAAKARKGSLVIVDACRDDPFVEARAARGADAATRSVGAGPLRAGLAATEAPAPDGVVFYSTQPGQTALDGDGLASPFLRALLETLGERGQAIDAVVRRTTDRVSESTAAKQTPAFYGAAPKVALLPAATGR